MSEIQSNIDNLTLFSEDYKFVLSLRINKFENKNDEIKFIKNCEKLVRCSTEYKLWKSYIVNVLKDNFCHVTLETNDQVSIEIHHHIPSLFSIVRTIVNKYLHNEIQFCSFDICLDIIELHFKNKIGYIPLINSMHEKFHNGSLVIPTSLVKGNYREFIDEYSNYIDDEDFEVINERMNIVDNKNYLWSKDNYPGIINS